MEFAVLEAQVLARPDIVEHGPGASAAEIASAEAKLRVPLSSGYRQFLARFGWLGLGSIEIYGVGAGVPKHLDLLEITQSERTEMHPRLRSDLIPIMNDGGGNLYCVDTRQPTSEAIVFWDHDLDADQEPEFVSPSFEEWLHEKLNEA
jgi:cell wall assembly regulator SMI1